MNEKVQKFVKTAGMYVGKKAIGKMPPAVQLDRILNQIERITKLAYVTEAEKQEGLVILWDMYSKVQKYIDSNKYTGDESWGNASADQETGWWGSEFNTEVNYTSYGDAFDDVIDASLVDDARVKPHFGSGD